MDWSYSSFAQNINIHVEGVHAQTSSECKRGDTNFFKEFKRTQNLIQNMCIHHKRVNLLMKLNRLDCTLSE